MIVGSYWLHTVGLRQLQRKRKRFLLWPGIHWHLAGFAVVADHSYHNNFGMRSAGFVMYSMKTSRLTMPSMRLSGRGPAVSVLGLVKSKGTRNTFAIAELADRMVRILSVQGLASLVRYLADRTDYRIDHRDSLTGPLAGKPGWAMTLSEMIVAGSLAAVQELVLELAALPR